MQIFVALPLTTRKISLLYGVLHLQEDAVSEVLEHMEVVRKLRNRITERLMKVKTKKRPMDRKAGWVLLDGIRATDFKILARLSELDTADDSDQHDVRITYADCKELLAQYDAKTSVVALDEFYSRDSNATYLMEAKSTQATAQTAHTLQYEDGSDQSTDTITVEEFAKLILREVAIAMNEAKEYGVREERLLKWEREVASLAIVTEEGIEEARQLARTKQLFRAVDKDGSGSITKTELYTALRRYKVTITKSEFTHVLRVIDPDQSGSMSIEEWIDFMMATDANLDKNVNSVIESDRVRNAEKGLGMTQLMGEVTPPAPAAGPSSGRALFLLRHVSSARCCSSCCCGCWSAV